MSCSRSVLIAAKMRPCSGSKKWSAVEPVEQSSASRLSIIIAPSIAASASTFCGSDGGSGVVDGNESRWPCRRFYAARPIAINRVATGVVDKAVDADKRASVADPRIIDIKLDERTILWRIGRCRAGAADRDLRPDRGQQLSRRSAPIPTAMPGRICSSLAVEEGRLVLDISREDGSPLETLMLSLGTLRRPIRDYFAICDSYYQAIRNATPAQIETVDMARRGIHNDAAELLKERLDGKIEVDFDTARRLFTLICVLHIRG